MEMLTVSFNHLYNMHIHYIIINLDKEQIIIETMRINKKKLWNFWIFFLIYLLDYWLQIENLIAMPLLPFNHLL